MADTRARILAEALALFNESGTAAISTNHIAQAAAISPGNLYYHFRNKEAIIRELFEQLFARNDALYQLPEGRPPALADLRGLVRATFELGWEHRFIYRELVALLRRDDALRERWLAVRARGFAGFHELVAQFVAAGVLRSPGDAAAIARLAEICWMISELWLVSVELGGEALGPDQIARGEALMLQVLTPYLAAPR